MCPDAAGNGVPEINAAGSTQILKREGAFDGVAVGKQVVAQRAGFAKQLVACSCDAEG